MPPVYGRMKSITQNIFKAGKQLHIKPSFILAVYSYFELVSKQNLRIGSHLISEIITEVLERMGGIGNFFFNIIKNSMLVYCSKWLFLS